MGLDSFSFVAPARVKLLLVPVGRIKQSRFSNFVGRLQSNNVVRLGDISPTSRPNKTLFSPLAFPEGLIVFDVITDLATATSPASHLALAPFELYQRPLLIVGVLDRLEYQGNQAHGYSWQEEDGHVSTNGSYPQCLSSYLERLRDEFASGLSHQLLVFDEDEEIRDIHEEIWSVPSPQKSRTTTMKTIMCDLASILLASMTDFAKSIQSAPIINTPTVSGTVGATTDILSAIPAHLSKASRTNSIGETPRSPQSEDPKWTHRMSLPVNFASNKSSRSTTPISRPSSPAPGAQTPPVLGDDMPGVAKYPTSRKTSEDRPRTHSRDRSLQQQESSNVMERVRIKQKGRVGVILASLYLLAGRWPDAARELVQSTNAARANSDYVWQAKCLDYLSVCVMMSAWAGMDFNVPDVLRPTAERPGSSSSKKRSSHSPPEIIVPRLVDPEKKVSNLQNLADVLPDVLINILNLYSRAWTFTDDKIPPFNFSHSTLRFAKLLTKMKRRKGQLDEPLLRNVVLGNAAESVEGLVEQRRPFLSDSDISSLAMRAYPLASISEAMPAEHQIAVLASIASILSDLGYHRKKALILRDIVSRLLPELVQARKLGAAEMGVHPAASLASLQLTTAKRWEDFPHFHQGQSEAMITFLLSYICEAFRIQIDNSILESTLQSKVVEPQDGKRPDLANVTISISAAIEQVIFSQAGRQDLKLDVLRSCINICEALPDLAGALEYSAKLLKTAGKGIAPGPNSSNGSPELPIEEQVRLVNNISRTLSAAHNMGLPNPEAEYWDEFLVRGIELLEVAPSMRLAPHARSELEIAESIEVKKERNPFIYNPFLKASNKKETNPVVPALEETRFRVTLQNLYDIDLYVEEIRLEADSATFESREQSTVIGPYRTQTLVLTAHVQSPGALKITGCFAKVRGCRGRSFTSFTEPWELKPPIKGVNLDYVRNRPIPEAERSETSPQDAKTQFEKPKPSVLNLEVVRPQPSVYLSSMSVSQSTFMLLEGEKRMLTINLNNTSKHVSTDLILCSFNDSVMQQYQDILSNQNLTSLELYELELAAALKPAFRWVRSVDGTPKEHNEVSIPPQQNTTLDVEVQGRPGLTFCTIQIDYSHLGASKQEVKEQFFTRQLAIPLAVTVNASIDLVRSDALPLPYNFFPTAESETELPVSLRHMSYNGRRSGLLDSPASSKVNGQTLTLLTLDLRNSWPKTLMLHLEVTELAGSTATEAHVRRLNYAIAPGSTTRIPIVVSKIYVPSDRIHKPIPSLNPATVRQFVVSKTKVTPSEELALREAFWLREELLKCLHARWEEEETGRTGDVELRALRLNARMVAALKLGDVAVDMAVSAAHEMTVDGCLPLSAGSVENEVQKGTEESEQVEQVENRFSKTPTNVFVTLTTRLRNRSNSPIKAILRLQPTLAGQPHNIALDLGKKLLVNGLLQQALPILQPEQTVEVEISFVVLSRGVYEWNACVEELMSSNIAGHGRGESTIQTGTRPRAKTGDMNLRGAQGRRIWYAETPCTIIANDLVD